MGFALFGGLTPFISLSLIYYTGWLTIPALYLIAVSLLGMIALVLLGRNYNQNSDPQPSDFSYTSFGNL